MMPRRTQPLLFNPADIPPLRALVNETRLHKANVKAKGLKFTIGLELAVDRLTKAVDAVLDADPVAMRLAGITPNMALELARRLQSAAGALIQVQP